MAWPGFELKSITGHYKEQAFSPLSKQKSSSKTLIEKTCKNYLLKNAISAALNTSKHQICSSVAMGRGAGGYISPPLAWKVCKTALFSAFGVEFCSRTENSTPKGIGEQKLWKACCYLEKKSEVFFLKQERKSDWISAKTFFLRSLDFDRKTASISFKIDENLV